MGDIVHPDDVVPGEFYVATNCDGHKPDVEVPFVIRRGRSYPGIAAAPGYQVWGFCRHYKMFGYRTHGMDWRGWLNSKLNKDIVIRKDHDRRLDPRPEKVPKPPKVKPPKPLTRMEMLEARVAELERMVKELYQRLGEQ